MTGRDKSEMVHRAEHIKKIFSEFGIELISPVLEEGVKADHVKLINVNVDKIKTFWDRDKYIIRRISHAVLFDHAEMASLGMTREYSLNRGTLWKPTVILIPPGTPISVAALEDDSVTFSVHSAAQIMAEKWGSRWKRWTWRAAMINRTLPNWFLGQILAWR